MLELPEVLLISRQLNESVVGKRVEKVLPPSRLHKFCWYSCDPAQYDELLSGCTIQTAVGFGIYVEIVFSGQNRLCFNDGVNVRLLKADELPRGYQLAILLEGDWALVFTVAMYGSIIWHQGGYDNEYYLKSREFISPFEEAFAGHYWEIMEQSREGLSVKAFLATEQRFPGVGNGVLQDILFVSHLHPKRKIGTLSVEERERLLHSLISVLKEMTDRGGRDTEKNLYGEQGAYPTKMSRLSYGKGCPMCAGPIRKEAYLGGSVYYCPICQPLI